MTRSTDSRRVRSRVTSLALAVLAALWLMPSGLAVAASITVTTVADENGSGPNCSLREAIASANGDADVGGCVGVGTYGADTIVFGSTLSLPATITLTDPAGALTVSSDVTITGPGATQLAIDGNHTTQVFYIGTGHQVMLSDLTIQHGNANSDFGGGILNVGTLTLTNCTLRGNSAGIGGGITNYHTATLTNCTLSGNSAADAGALYNFGSTAKLTNCTLSENGVTILNFCVPILFDGCSPGSVTLTNTIIADSAGQSCGGSAITDGGHNLIEDATSSCGLTNGVNGDVVGSIRCSTRPAWRTTAARRRRSPCSPAARRSTPAIRGCAPTRR
jgi:CSLREA domain-containing protein